MMVPIQPALTPQWNFQPQTNSQDVKIPDDLPLSSTYPSYMPALNRAGWYKYFFLEMLCDVDSLEKLMRAFCADTYKPNVLNQPDLQKRDRSDAPALTARAKALRTRALERACKDAVSAIQAAQGGVAEQDGLDSKMQQQINSMLNHSSVKVEHGFSSATGDAFMPRY